MTAYRSNAKCSRVSWCTDPAGHEGWHHGPIQGDGASLRQQRVAPPGATDADVVVCHDILLSEAQRKGLTIGGHLPSFQPEPLPWWQRLFRWVSSPNESEERDG